MADSLQNLFDPSRLHQVLQEQNMLPQWVQNRPYERGSNVLGTYEPDPNRLTAAVPDNPIRQNTLAHEMAHAVQYNTLKSMANAIAEKKWNKQEVTKQEEQYLRAAEQLMRQQFGRIGQYNRGRADEDRGVLENIINKLYNMNGEGGKRYNEYRTMPNELGGYGIGNFSYPAGADPNENSNPHLDASMTQDFDTLLTMYQSLPETIRQLGASRRREEIPNAQYGNYPDPFRK